MLDYKLINTYLTPQNIIIGLLIFIIFFILFIRDSFTNVNTNSNNKTITLTIPKDLKASIAFSKTPNPRQISGKYSNNITFFIVCNRIHDSNTYTLLDINNSLIQINRKNIIVKSTILLTLKNPIIDSNNTVIISGKLVNNKFSLTIIDNKTSKSLLSNKIIIQGTTPTKANNDIVSIGYNNALNNNFNGFIPLVFIYSRTLELHESKQMIKSLKNVLPTLNYYYENINNKDMIQLKTNINFMKSSSNIIPSN